MLAITTRFKKPIAWFFAFLFYLELIGTAISARASVREYIPGVKPVRLIGWNDIANRDVAKGVNSDSRIYDNIKLDSLAFRKNSDNNKLVRGPSFEGPGPTQPEMQAFSSVNANNMVDLFSGDFSYNIPLLDVGGYPVNISYRSGISMDQEASWCGLGWNINPGTITRNLRGIPDDFSGADSIRKIVSIKENKTVGVTAGGDIEITGLPLSLGASVGIFHNNYKGWGLENSVNTSISAGVGSKGGLTGGLALNNNSQEGLTITPSVSLSLSQKTADEKSGLDGSLSLALPYNSRTGLRNLQLSAGVRQYSEMKVNYGEGKSHAFKGRQSSHFSTSISFASPTAIPTISMPFTSRQFSFTGKVGGEFGIAHPSAYVSGYVSKQKIDAADTLQSLPAYGYLHFQDGNKTKNPLLDFNREKELMYRDKPPVPHIAVPFYTYDAFSITGEGTGGMFRAYRGDIGYIHDHLMRTKNESDGASIDVGLGNLVHIGVDVNESYSFTQNSAWLEENSINSLIAFKGNNEKFEGVYFRNPGEKAINSKSFYESLGGDDVVTVGLYQSGSSSSVIQATSNLIRYKNKKKVGTIALTKQNAVKSERDKRSQVISYLTAKEASIVGLNKYIENYGLNKFDMNNCTSGAGEPDGPHGLAAEYYMTKDLKDYVYRKIESTINYDWINGGPTFYLILPPLPNGTVIPPLPVSGINDRFSMRWKGRIKAPVTGAYTFTTSSDDGVRLWINDSLLINRWNDHPVATDNVTLNLVEGEMYNIKMEYYENKGKSAIKLEWAYPGQSKQVIPESAFYLPQTDGFTFNSNLELERRETGYRKENHISQIDVLNPDGRRYVYGIPVYNFKQKEATFAVSKAGGSTNTGLVKYQHGLDNTTANNKGIDNYFSSEEVPAYAHSFLLTGILSPDYVDVTGNGISDDDLGDAVKFKYSKVNGIANPFKWRAPYVKDSVTYNDGLKTDNRDDKGSYTYGEKELWYMHSIESKTMIATFVVESRLDQLAIDESGKKYNDSSAKRLKEINLYSKADFLKNGVNAKPIKTVHFDYTYELCRGYNKPVNDSGKLTLKRIWFTYNKNQKVRQNPYVFNYNSKNPAYDLKSYDRWGNYKPPLENPGSTVGNVITNAEYPYAIQDSSVAARNAAAWALDSIYLPSGGSLKVTYESDDYAYVQNKRAMQLFKIAGFGSTPGLTNTVAKLYSGSSEHLYVYVNVPSPVSSKAEVYRKYLKNISKLYFKLFVEMPTDAYGNGYEYIPCYANLDADNYGIVSGQPNMLWVKITGVNLNGDGSGDYSPLAKAAIQFLRLNLPSKAYPGSQTGSSLDAQAAIQMLLAMADNIKSSFTSFDRTARGKGWAAKIDTGRSYIRLNTPEYVKYGGGYRVKRVTIYDNWNKMVGGRSAMYGQDYIYKTVQKIDGQNKLISSGVANWEPGIGGEENPFREPIEYTEEISILGPVAMGYSEEPLGESLFPSPQVGYSKVRVRTINYKNIRSANGYAETGFYTAYDFPVYTDRTLIDGDTKKRFKPAISNFLKINAKYYLGISQGFKVELNDMHGKLRYEASYSETKPNEPISYTENIYRVDNAQTDQKRLSNTVISMKPDGSVDTTSLIGKEVELMIDMREQLSVTSGNNTSVNAEIFSVPFIPFFMVIPTFFRMPQREENKFRSVATTKVIQRYGILDSVIHIDKGSKISTRDLMYDAETGEVLLSRTQNEFNDPVYNFSYPAHWAYDGIGLAYKNISTVIHHVSFTKGKIASGLSVPETSLFSSGDEILVAGKQFTGTSGCTPFASFSGFSKIWAFDSAVTGQGTSKFYFIDEEGKPYTANDVSIKIIRSGRKNMGGAVGAVTLLTNPLVKNGSQYELKIDTGSQVINASASEFRNIWQVQDLKKRTRDITIKDTIPADCNADTSCTCKCLKKLFDYLIASKRLFIKSSQNITVGQIVQDANNAGYTMSISDCNVLLRNQFKPFYARTSNVIGNRYIAQIGDCIVKINSTDSKPLYFYGLRSTACDGNATVQYYDTLSNVYFKRLDITKSLTVYQNKLDYDGYIYNGPLTSYIDTLTPSLIGAAYQNTDHPCCGSNILRVESYFKFDSISTIPGGVDIESATLQLYAYPQGFNPPQYYDAHTLKDTSMFASVILRPNSNWNYSTSISTFNSFNWSWVGDNKFYINDPFQDTAIDVKSQVINSMAYGNYGFNLMSPFNSPLRYISFASQRHPNPNKRPSLNIQYTSGSVNHAPIASLQIESCQSRDTIIGISCESVVKDTASNPFVTGILGNWRGDKSYAYYAARKESDPTADVNLRKDGTIKDYAGFWKFDNGKLKPQYDTTRWVWNSRITMFNQKGFELENKDPLNRYNAALYGYNETLPIAVVQNSKYRESAFEGFEDYGFATRMCDTSCPASRHFDFSSYASKITTLQKHSGKSSIKLNAFEQVGLSFRLVNAALDTALSHLAIQTGTDACASGTIVKAIRADSTFIKPSFSPIAGRKMLVSAWVKEDQECNCSTYVYNQIRVLSNGGTGAEVILKPSGAIIEGWQRYEGVFTSATNDTELTVSLEAIGNVAVYFDDLRVQPFNANMKSFVYSPVNLRLMAELDENNYTTFYEYDDDGTLIRVKKETEQGIKTIKETRSALLKQ